MHGQHQRIAPDIGHGVADPGAGERSFATLAQARVVGHQRQPGHGHGDHQRQTVAADDLAHQLRHRARQQQRQHHTPQQGRRDIAHKTIKLQTQRLLANGGRTAAHDDQLKRGPTRSGARFSSTGRWAESVFAQCQQRRRGTAVDLLLCARITPIRFKGTFSAVPKDSTPSECVLANTGLDVMTLVPPINTPGPKNTGRSGPPRRPCA